MSNELDRGLSVMNVLYFKIKSVGKDEMIMKSTISGKQIIKFLNQQDTYVSAEQIAEKFHVSAKTVYRRIEQINTKYNEKLIKSEKGKGFRIISSSPTLLEKGHFIEPNTPEERRKNVLLKLLFSAPRFLDIEYLFQNEYVSESTEFLDIGKIKETMERFNLEVKQKTRRVSIQGSERSIREAINSLLRYENEDLAIVPVENISAMDASFIQEQLKFIKNMSQTEIPYPYNVNIFSHIYILIQRARYQTNRATDVYNESLEVITKEIEQYPDLYRIAEIVIENVGNYIVKKMRDFEIVYLFKYLLSSRLIGEREQIREESIYSKLVINFTNKLVNEVNSSLEINIDEKRLRQELIRHIGPMINRIENKITVENSLLSDIKLEYGELFAVIKQNSKRLCRELNLPNISENEVGFITLYFAKHIEQSQKQYHVWLVCASGVGTSELLKAKIQSTFRNITVDKVLSSVDETLYRQDVNIDLVITTVDLSKEFKVNSVVVSALLNNKDKENIKSALYKTNN